MYKILSWDVGIKNLAYCILEKNDMNYTIKKWDIINIIDSDLVETCCNDGCKNPSKFSGVYNNVTSFYCGTHKKKHNKLLPGWENAHVTSDTSKQKCNHKNTLGKECGKNSYCKTSNGIYLCNPHKKSHLNNIEKQNKLVEIKHKKCTDFAPSELTLKMFSKLDSIPELLQVDQVLIENQPALKNPPIKAVGSSLFSYFILRGIIDKEKTHSNITKVNFISPSNKLKVNPDKTLQTLTKTVSGEKYKLTKKLAIEYTKLLLKSEDGWLKHLNSYKKKDDLCDALLQGYHYMYFKLDKRKSMELKMGNNCTDKKNANDDCDGKKTAKKDKKKIIVCI